MGIHLLAQGLEGAAIATLTITPQSPDEEGNMDVLKLDSAVKEGQNLISGDSISMDRFSTMTMELDKEITEGHVTFLFRGRS